MKENIEFQIKILEEIMRKQQELINNIFNIIEKDYVKKSEYEEDLFKNCSNYVIPKQVILDKIEELDKNELLGKMNFEQVKFTIDILQEILVKGEKDDNT